MAKLERCGQCDGFKVGNTCPHCRATVSRLGLLATAIGGSAFALTLMACYGCPPGDSCYGGPIDGSRKAADASADTSDDLPTDADDAGEVDSGQRDAADDGGDGGDENDGGDGGDADAA